MSDAMTDGLRESAKISEWEETLKDCSNMYQAYNKGVSDMRKTFYSKIKTCKSIQQLRKMCGIK